MSDHQPLRSNDGEIPDEALLDADEAAEEVAQDADVQMGSDASGDEEGTREDGTQEEIILENDSIAHFDQHADSIFCIAQHPTHPEIIATGGGDDVAYIFDSRPPETPVLPASYQSNPEGPGRKGLTALARLEGHTDSVNAVTFTLPNGDFAVTAGLDGRLRAYRDTTRDRTGQTWELLHGVQDVEEINWLAPCPDPEAPNIVALGANDGSVWIYQIENVNSGDAISMIRVSYLHTQSCTAGTWSADGKLLATVSEDGSFHVIDLGPSEKPAVVSLTAQDRRFEIEGGLYSVAISPSGPYAAVGGAGGQIRVINLPKPGAATGSRTAQIVASIRSQTDSIETLAFTPAPARIPLLAAGSVDGSIALFDQAHRFAQRRLIQEAHGGHAVVKVEFVDNVRSAGPSTLLTSAGMDGVVRRWITQGMPSSPVAGQGMTREWKGHRGEEDGGGVLDFVQDSRGERIITAGDDGVSLVFNAFVLPGVLPAQT
ncbi:MAG: hypothetical protein M1823_004158 [Watsoniomyces obsoletus]|nr:MAG: hypothetical protein M1823_004158 [Watsoniomyces obsoletus]